ncbi:MULTISPECIES: branched-chain amino acid ABC transporter permease [Streptomyces]|uniref:ABC transporter permease n=2 Tax=Streptomyces TaxID=1883 RepID=A0A100Y1J0_9ACTN|nr:MULTISPECIES: branched-chain amino acid ABC transporter permease [Streptomyces]KUH35981.1 ABC transporter permease [Streptomyces kanasensis]UUS30546.1 branched-chain amino acid ABC transporter permease [Streptomyces changanensis]
MSAVDSSVKDVASAASRLRRTAWYQQPRFTRLWALLALGVLLALVTGEQGNTRDIFFSIESSLLGPHLWVCLGLTVAVWALREFAGEPIKGAVGQARSATGGPVGALRDRFQGDRRLRWGLMGLALVLALVVPSMLSRTWQTVLVDQIAIFALLAIGLNVVIGWAGLLDLGFFAFFAVGAYSTAFWTGRLPIEPPVVLNPFWVIPIAVVTCLVTGLLLGAPTLRLRGDYLAIVTLGFHEIIYLVAKNADGVTGGPQGARLIPDFSFDFAGIAYKWSIKPLPYWYLLVFFIVLVIILFSRLEHSRVGRAWTAIREDEIAAAANGVDTVRFKLMAFAIGASTSGVAGVIFTSKYGYINPEVFPLLQSILILAYVIFGGMGSIPGVLMGAAALVWLPEALKDYVDPSDRYMYLGALLVIMMIYRPQGIWPSRRRQRELKLAEEGLGDADAMSEPAGGKVR